MAPVVLGALAVAIGLAHLALGSPGLADAGPRVVVGHLYALAAVAVLFGLATLIGRPAIRALRLPADGPVETLVFAAAFGTGIVSTALLALGAVGLLHPAVTWGSLFAGGAAAWWSGRGRVGSDGASIGPGGGAIAGPGGGVIAPGGGGELAPAAAAAVFVAVGLFLVVQGLAPASDWDSLMYHLRIPSQFLERGAVFLPEDNLHVTRVGLAQLLYLPVLAIGAAAGPALISVALTLLTGLTAFALADRFFGRRPAWLVLVTVWGSTTILMVGMTARVDVSVAFYALVAHYAVLLALEGEEEDGALVPFVAAGILAGFALGVKIQAVLYVLALGPIVVWAAVRRGRAIAMTSAAAAVVAVTAAPWLVKNAVLVGAPLYPALARPRLEPWLERLYGGRDYPAGYDPGLTRLIWEFRARLNPVDFFLRPGRLAIEGEARHYFGNPILLFLPVGLFSRPRRLVAAVTVPAVLYLAALLLTLPEANPRYLIPGLLPLTVVAVLGLDGLVARAPAPARRWIAIGACVLALFPTGRTMMELMTRTAAPAHAIGAEPGVRVIRTRGEPAVELLATALAADPSLAAPGARTLMLFDARGHYFGGEVVQDNLLLNWVLLTRSPGFGPGWCPRDAGFTHVLVNEGALDYYRRSGLDPDRLGWSRFADVATRCLEGIGGGFGLRLYRDTTAARLAR